MILIKNRYHRRHLQCASHQRAVLVETLRLTKQKAAKEIKDATPKKKNILSANSEEQQQQNIEIKTPCCNCMQY